MHSGPFMSRRFVLDAPKRIPSLEAIYKRPGSLVREARFEPFLVKLGLCPSEPSVVLVATDGQCVDISDEFLDAGEGGPVERFPGRNRESDFDLIEPGGRVGL